MATPFSQTIRALEIDNYRAILIVMSTAILLLLLWLIWFFNAPVGLVESSQSLQVQPDVTQNWYLPENAQRVQLFKQRRIVAIFPEEKIGLFYPDQPAWIKLEGQRTSIKAKVISVKLINHQAAVTVETSFPAKEMDVFTHNRHGQISIEIAKVTPSALVFHVSGFSHQSVIDNQ